MINACIDYTYLKEDCSPVIVSSYCIQALEKGYAGVCFYPRFVPLAVSFLQESTVAVVTVIDFPLGLSALSQRLLDTEQVLKEGVDEVDLVMNYTALKRGQIEEVQEDISQLSALVHRYKKKIKVIIESGELSMVQVEQACAICVEAEVDFVKTSTGKTAIGAEPEKVAFMRAYLPSSILIKASGGIKTVDEVVQFVSLGAARIGISSYV